MRENAASGGFLAHVTVLDFRYFYFRRGAQNKIVNQPRRANVGRNCDQRSLRDSFYGVERVGINNLEIIEFNFRLAREGLFAGGDQRGGVSFPSAKCLLGALQRSWITSARLRSS